MLEVVRELTSFTGIDRYTASCTGMDQYSGIFTGTDQYTGSCTGMDQYTGSCTGFFFFKVNIVAFVGWLAQNAGMLLPRLCGKPLPSGVAVILDY